MSPADETTDEASPTGEDVSQMMERLFETIHKQSVKHRFRKNRQSLDEILDWGNSIEQKVTTNARKSLALLAAQANTEINRLGRKEESGLVEGLSSFLFSPNDLSKDLNSEASNITAMLKQLQFLSGTCKSEYRNFSKKVAKLLTSVGVLSGIHSSRYAVFQTANFRRYRLVTVFLCERIDKIRKLVAANNNAVDELESRGNAAKIEIEEIKAKIAILSARHQLSRKTGGRTNTLAPFVGLPAAEKYFQRAVGKVADRVENLTNEKQNLQREIYELSERFGTLIHHRATSKNQEMDE
jgi:hypothetical protein